MQFSATARDSAGNPVAGRGVTWSSRAKTVAAVNQSGLVLATAPGAVLVTANAEGRTTSAGVRVECTADVSVVDSAWTQGVRHGKRGGLTPMIVDGGAAVRKVVVHQVGTTAVPPALVLRLIDAIGAHVHLDTACAVRPVASA